MSFALRFRFGLAVLATVAMASLCATANDADFAREIAPFLQKHCVDCHGPETQKAKLRLDTLKPDFDEHDAAELWTHVFDKVATNAMPPASEERPAAAELKAFTHFLEQKLHDASLAKQARQGRVLMRRLNRTEYEN